MDFVVLLCDNFHTLLYKVSITRINYAKYLILRNPYIAMKHGNSSLLQFPIFLEPSQVCTVIYNM